MPDAVYGTLALLCTLVEACPVGTNPGLLHLLWMQVSRRLLEAHRAAPLPLNRRPTLPKWPELPDTREAPGNARVNAASEGYAHPYDGHGELRPSVPPNRTGW